jgi:RNA polymerase sigma factor (TIGR02999 family)
MACGIVSVSMSESAQVTQVLKAIQQGEAVAAEQLLPLVYDELRRLAAHRLAGEPAGQTLQATGLVHEAYVRLVDTEHQARWDSRGHFFAAAAEAMRRILVENARRKAGVKHGGRFARRHVDEFQIAEAVEDDELIAVDEALERLAKVDVQAAELVKLRYFAGLSIPQVAEVLGISARTADRIWAYAKAWLFENLKE